MPNYRFCIAVLKFIVEWKFFENPIPVLLEFLPGRYSNKTQSVILHSRTSFFPAYRTKEFVLSAGRSYPEHSRQCFLIAFKGVSFIRNLHQVQLFVRLQFLKLKLSQNRKLLKVIPRLVWDFQFFRYFTILEMKKALKINNLFMDVKSFKNQEAFFTLAQ